MPATPRVVGAGYSTAIPWAWETEDGQWWRVVEWVDKPIAVDPSGDRWIVLDPGLMYLRPVTDEEWRAL